MGNAGLYTRQGREGDLLSAQIILLIAALMRVESGGSTSLATPGPRGEVGCLQIRPVVIRDLNRIAGRQRFTMADRLDRSRSVEIFNAYVYHYATAERIGREPTLEDMARIWNGGPRGYRKPETAAYWQKVRAEMLTNARR